MFDMNSVFWGVYTSDLGCVLSWGFSQSNNYHETRMFSCKFLTKWHIIYIKTNICTKVEKLDKPTMIPTWIKTISVPWTIYIIIATCDRPTWLYLEEEPGWPPVKEKKAGPAANSLEPPTSGLPKTAPSRIETKNKLKKKCIQFDVNA